MYFANKSFKKFNMKKSSGDESGDRSGHVIDPPQLIQRMEKVADVF